MNESPFQRLRTSLGIAVLAVALLLAWRCLSLGMADLLASTNPTNAISWRAAHPEAEYAMAQADFLTHQNALAMLHARLAIASAPLDGRAYRVAAAVAESMGDQVRAKTLFEVAERRAPRDLPTRIKLAEYALKAGDHEHAIHEVDMLLRMQPELYSDVLPRLVRLTEDPEAVGPIVHALSHRPAWRWAFLSMLAGNARNLETASKIFSRLSGEEALSPNVVAARQVLQARLHAQGQQRASSVADDQVIDHAIATYDWFALMDWKQVSDSAYDQAEDPFDSIGTP